MSGGHIFYVCNLYQTIGQLANVVLIFSSLALQPKSGRLIVKVSIPHTFRHTCLKELLDRHRSRYLHNKQETNIHALSGIRTRNPSKEAAGALRFRRAPGSAVLVYSRLNFVTSVQ